MVGRTTRQIVWFKRDLRVHDHEPLVRAAAAGPVIPLYIVEPELWSQPDADAGHWTFIAESLHELDRSLTRLGAPLIVRCGDATTVLADLLGDGDVERIWAHEETGNGWTYARDRRVRAWAKVNGVAMTEVPRDFVVRRLSDRDGWSDIAKARLARPVHPTPVAVRPVVPAVASSSPPTAADLGLMPTTRAGSMRGGEDGARRLMTSFLAERCRGYEKQISSPITAEDGCSRLSPHLTYGTLSLRELIGRTRRTAGQEPSKRFSLKAFEERLHWRSHFIQKLEDEPALEHQSYLPRLDGLRLDPLSDPLGAARFDAWSTGRTGYPMVDACMRALTATGWINFRMRAMLVSFASYDLWLDWRPTATFLARMFVDYEPGIHYPQIQMQSGTTGINAIRIYDPVKQGREHDPDGTFVRRWIPELAQVDLAVGAAVHEPWTLEGTIHGRPPSYPDRIVDHAAAVAHAWKHLDRWRDEVKRSGEAAAVYEQHGSRRPPPSTRQRASARR